MKSLKQIREECESSFVNQVNLPDEMVLDESLKNVPTVSKMPNILIFRRMSYKMFPGGNYVALYYSSMLGKYLSIPFGSEGNLNLAESRIHESSEDLNEIWGAVARTVGSWALNKMLGGKSDSQKDKQNKEKEEPISTPLSTELKKSKGSVKTRSTWEQKPESSAIDRARTKSIDIAQSKSVSKPSAVYENKMSDIRKMVNENIETKDIYINGKQITLNNSMAKRILEVYDGVNVKNKRIVESMLNEDMDSFKKLLNFSIRN